MRLVFVERKNWRELGYTEEANDIEIWLREQLGFIPVRMKTKLECKVCRVTVDGYDAGKHLQTKDHLKKREELLELVASPDELYCEDCIMLMQEDNPYSGLREDICRLGYSDQYEDEFGNPKVNYSFHEDLDRPESCRRLSYVDRT